MRENKTEDILRAVYISYQSEAILNDLIISKKLTFNEVLNVLAQALKIVLASASFEDNINHIDDNEVHEILQDMIEQVETGVKLLKEGKK
jgi:hypothetical protein